MESTCCKGLAKTAVEHEFVEAKLRLLEHARKKTTQKVNLFEKVQIPGYQEAVRKIKRSWMTRRTSPSPARKS
jgi:V/A-type H+-transporting ATPase subunit D